MALFSTQAFAAVEEFDFTVLSGKGDRLRVCDAGLTHENQSEADSMIYKFSGQTAEVTQNAPSSGTLVASANSSVTPGGEGGLLEKLVYLMDSTNYGAVYYVDLCYVDDVAGEYSAERTYKLEANATFTIYNNDYRTRSSLQTRVATVCSDGESSDTVTYLNLDWTNVGSSDLIAYTSAPTVVGLQSTGCRVRYEFRENSTSVREGELVRMTVRVHGIVTAE